MAKIPIIILAAGASSRMGVIKQLLNWGEESLLSHAIKTTLELSNNDVIVVLGANSDIIKIEIEHYPVSIIYNEKWQQGLGNSIACGINYIMEFHKNADGALIVLADQPLIDADYLNELIQNFSPSKIQIIATSYSKGTYGVPVLFDKSYFDDLMQLHDDFGAKQLLRKNESHVKVLIPPNKNVDLDTKEDYEFYKGLNSNP